MAGRVHQDRERHPTGVLGIKFTPNNPGQWYMDT